MKRLILLFILIPSIAYAGFLTDGTDDRCTVSLDLSSYDTIALSFWLYWDSYSSSDDLAFEQSTNYNSTTGFIFDPDGSTGGGGGNFEVGASKTGVGAEAYYFTRPSAATWHHYVINFDRTVAEPVASVYVDGVSQTLTKFVSDKVVDGNFANQTLYIMCRNNTSLNGDGRLDEFAIWGGINLSQADVNQLYSRIKGSPFSVQPSSLIRYWPLDDYYHDESVDGNTYRDYVSGNSITCNDGANNTGMTSVGHVGMAYR